MKAIINARVVTPDEIIDNGYILIEGERIVKSGSLENDRVPENAVIIDAEGLYAGPGFVDIHCHGGGRYWCHTQPAEMAAHHLNHGTTSLVCSIYKTVGFDGTIKGIELIKKCCYEKNPGNIAGIHLEGPYLSPGYGAASMGVTRPVPAEYNAYIEHSEGLLRNWTFSPEMDGLDDFVETAVKHAIPLSIGHSGAGPDEVDKYVKKGVSIVTHLMDATGCSITPARFAGTREPSFDECVMVHDLFTEVIPDSKGVHVRPVMLKLIAKTMGYDRVIIVTDACPGDDVAIGDNACPGDVVAIGDNACVGDVVALNDCSPEDMTSARDINFVNGELYGSKLTMNEACRNMKKHIGCGMAEIFKMAAKNPAQAIKLNEAGTIEDGKIANIVIVDEDFNIHHVLLNGMVKYSYKRP